MASGPVASLAQLWHLQVNEWDIWMAPGLGQLINNIYSRSIISFKPVNGNMPGTGAPCCRMWTDEWDRAKAPRGIPEGFGRFEFRATDSKMADFQIREDLDLWRAEKIGTIEGTCYIGPKR